MNVRRSHNQTNLTRSKHFNKPNHRKRKKYKTFLKTGTNPLFFRQKDRVLMDFGTIMLQFP